jgi:hypothetical protein
MRPDRLIDEPADWDERTLFRIRRGVLYRDVPLAASRALLKAARPIGLLCGMGPMVFWQRSDGPWISWDPSVRDENGPEPDSQVADREWPFCWGDEVRFLGVWEEQPLYCRWRLVESTPDSQDSTIDLAAGSPFDPGEAQRLVRWTLADFGQLTEGKAKLFGSRTLQARHFAEGAKPTPRLHFLRQLRGR